MTRPTSRRLVVFDFDGTLADTWRDLATALNRTLRDESLPEVTGPEVRFWVGQGVLPLLARAAPDADTARLERLRAHFFAHYERACLDTTKLYDGIAECLDACRGADLVIASNKPAVFLVPMARRLGITRHFAAIFGGDSLPVRKPDGAVLHQIHARLRERTGNDYDAIFMIGDSAIDVETGRNANATTIGCAWGLRGRKELEAAGVDHLIEDPSEIPALVSS